MIRQNIIMTIVSVLSDITVENGFYSSAGNNCFEWYEKALEKEDYPAIIVRDPADNSIERSSIWEHTLQIEVDIATNGKNSILNMREVVSDVLKSFGEVEKKISYKCSYKGSESLINQKDYLYSGTRMLFTVTYQTRAWEQ